MNENPYKRLAVRLDALPNGFPATNDGAELRLLAKLYTPEDAALAAELRLSLETPEQIASRLSDSGFPVENQKVLKKQLKQMARGGLIAAGKTKNGLSYGLLPFVVGVYEYQIGRMDAELAELFEDYYVQAFGETLSLKPAFHRVVPVDETIKVDMEVQPYESATKIVHNAQAWGVLDCICRLQKKLVGDPCEHPIDVCMILSSRPGAFDQNPIIRPLTCEGALDTLGRAAEAGLVHSVSNTQKEISYICNCCTCSCGILRGMADLGVANVVAHSPFINQVDEELCVSCEICIASCQFEALALVDCSIQVNRVRCVGCGVCVPICEEGALGLIRRPEGEIPSIPPTQFDWQKERALARGQELNQIL